MIHVYCEIRNLILLTNSEIHFPFRYVKDGQHLHMLGQKMEDLIFTVADTNFFFNDLEDCDQVSVFSFLLVSHTQFSFFWLAKTNLKEFTVGTASVKPLLCNLCCAVLCNLCNLCVFNFEILRLAEVSDTGYHLFDVTFWSDQILNQIFSSC